MIDQKVIKMSQLDGAKEPLLPPPIKVLLSVMMTLMTLVTLVTPVTLVTLCDD